MSIATGRIRVTDPNNTFYGQEGERRLANPGSGLWYILLDNGEKTYLYADQYELLTDEGEPVSGEPLEAAVTHAPVLKAGKATITEIEAAEAVQRATEPHHGYKLPTIYVSGPMTGHADYNYPAFNRAEEILRQMGYNVINPAKMDTELGIEGLTYHDLLARDLQAILNECDAGIALIDGWRNSRGSTTEAYIAQQAGLPVYELKEWDETLGIPPIAGNDYVLVPVERISVAYEAQSIVLGPRRYDYGHPLDNFMKIADLWHATFGHKLKEGERIDVRDVAMAMAQVKIAREYNQPKADNQTDISGYAYAYEESKAEAEARGIDLGLRSYTEADRVRAHSVSGFNGTAKKV